jgi:hypothetical protein
MNFRSTHVFSVKKADNSTNFAAGGIINRRTDNLLCRDKDKRLVTSYVVVYKAMDHVTVPRLRELSPSSTLVA